jgi:glucokinase
MGPAERAYRRSLAQRSRIPSAELRPAEMGNDAGVVGAGDLARWLLRRDGRT